MRELVRISWRTGLGALVLLMACSNSDDDENVAPLQPGPSAGGAPPVSAAAGSAGQTGGAPGADPVASPGESGPDPDLPLAGAGGQAGEPSEPALQEELAPLASVRQEHAVVALGDEVFVVGGFTPGASASVAAYDPAADSWRPVADFPSVFHHANAASLGGKLIVAGFYIGASFTDASNEVYEYDPALDAWAALSPLPAGTQRASSCVATLEGKLYLFGGARNGSVADSSVYDPATDSWQALPALPEPREHCAAGAIDGQIIIAGGRAQGIGGFQPGTWAFDPVAQVYAPRAPLLTARGGVAGSVLSGKLYIFGGEGNAMDPTGVFPQVEAYDPVTDSWEALPDMLFPRHGLAAATFEGRIYLPGGASQQGFGAEDTNTVFFLN